MTTKWTKLLVTFSLIWLQPAFADKDNNGILSLRDRAQVIDTHLDDRLENLLPTLMRREGIDMWILISREYNEDPVLKTMLPANWLSARRRTILVLFDPGKDEEGNFQAIERLAVARYNVDTMFRKSWDKEQQPNQWDSLVELIKQKNPQKIALNKSTTVALADGLTATEYEEFKTALGANLQSKIVSSEPLAIAWLETRSEQEMEVYPSIVKLSHNIVAQAFSNDVITPGLTTTEDVVWWLREKVAALKLQTWFHPTVSIQRASDEKFDQLQAFSKRPELQTIMPGDLLHLDFGITYLRLNTDQQQHAYVLKKGEKDAPEYLKKALANGNKLQDIFIANFKEGRTGNEVLAMSRRQAIDQGIKPAIYTHPIGFHGHAAGTTLGMWDSQGGVPGEGDYPLHANTAYSIELNAATFIPEWQKEIRIMLEEEAFFDGEKVEYLHGRQKQFHLISSE
ncbi:MAG: aminopeptidase P family protein [Paraglaciecola sp.]|uniref:M24 family metallopeptidase n=1 Tax=Paraglaciecola sp. TaxID=1920173 RepID=UPI00273F359E|nr:M24 family metallopeptidase [Paraglaciecola sp.]MDP5032645.1 aminopeptidase P family protein [Paraglaciecola sp.]MDP5132460.1 aminopeptidase P family protein [Paraglaciecola sp.]